jgi:ABC-type dipeptide/oligopeptide/nickel transport system permease subunit
MENEEMNNLVPNEENNSADFVYSVGEEAKDSNGESVDSSKFEFVQQDKSIHDVKFNTKPTTFMKDAMRRFTKNRSSVVGGIILGVLFVLALILPVSMTNFDIDERHNYETHLPMKLFPAGTGFWDGTRVSKNQNYPYEVDDNGEDVLDENGNKIFTDYENYPDESAIVSVKNKTAKYSAHADAGANGGFIRLTADKGSSVGGSMYGSTYDKYNFTTNTYKITYSLGVSDEYVAPKYSLIMYTSSNVYFINGGLTDNYGTAETKKDGASILPYSDITVNLNEAINNSKTLNLVTGLFSDAKVKATDFDNTAISFGIAFWQDENNSTGLFVHSYRIEGEKTAGGSLTANERKNLNVRSFGSTSTFKVDDATVRDANALALIEKTTDGKDNVSYWTRTTRDRFEAVDTFVVTADITYDMYVVTYGLRNNMSIDQSKLESWKKAGYVEYTSLDDLVTNPGNFKVTESGKNCNDVFVTEISSVKKDDSNATKDADGNVTGIIYTIKGQVMMYKFLGYSSVPTHIFGTEYQGKDMLKYVFAGLRTSLILGVIVSIINILIGVIWGSISGYYGGMVDITMERITDILGGIPYIVLMTVLTLKLGATFFVFALSLCLTGWIGTASTTRSQFYRYRGREYVLAAKTLGAKAPRLIFRHILPNAVGTIVTRSVLMIPSTIFSEATISYLGLGLTNLASLGVILSKNQDFLSTYPSELIIPAIIISLLMICFNLFGNGLRDAFNPSLKGED